MKRTQLIADEEFLDIYLRDISRYRPVKSEEEARLASGIRKGNRGDLDKLVKANLRFVVSVSRNYQNQGMALSDLINEGNIGLIRAAKRFDEKKNFKFISYAVWWIRQAILQALADQSRIVKLPLNRVGIIHRIDRVAERLEQRHGRRPGFGEVARELSIDENSVIETVKIGNRHLSIDAPFEDNEEVSLIDLLRDKNTPQPDEEITRESFRDNVKRQLDILGDREKEIIRLYFGMEGGTPHTLDEIGARLSLTRERVRQVKESALKRLREEWSPELLESIEN